MLLAIIFQVAAVVGIVWPLYRIGRRLFDDRISAGLLAVGWLAYPATSQFIYNASYGFRWGTFCLFLYFLALAFWLEDRRSSLMRSSPVVTDAVIASVSSLSVAELKDAGADVASM